MKIKITEELAVGHELDTYLLVNQEGDIEAYSGNTDFNDLGNEVPKGEYLVVKVLKSDIAIDDQAQLGCTLDVIGLQNHLGDNEVQEYEFGNMPTNLEKTS